MILYREVSWWYWAVTAVLLIVGLTGVFACFYLAAVLGVVQVVHFRLREGRFAAFPVQVRLAYTAILLVALWKPWLFWIPAMGTPAQVLFGYCALARLLSLLPLEPARAALMAARVADFRRKARAGEHPARPTRQRVERTACRPHPRPRASRHHRLVGSRST